MDSSHHSIRHKIHSDKSPVRIDHDKMVELKELNDNSSVSESIDNIINSKCSGKSLTESGSHRDHSPDDSNKMKELKELNETSVNRLSPKTVSKIIGKNLDLESDSESESSSESNIQDFIKVF